MLTHSHARSRPAEILLVEDSPADVRLVREALKECAIPHRLTTIDNGKEALAWLQREAHHADAPRPDIILLDLNLPGLDGRRIAAAIRADAALRHLPIIMLTSSRVPHDVRELYQIPVNCYIVKPLGFERFVAAVRATVEFWLGVATLPE
ncbi:MAG TPA: response regulator [Methylomirabilota bacterium]|jgi:CheY-like chemotaxis protein|nr:response regulator [Methylomirabilota bacterium]